MPTVYHASGATDGTSVLTSAMWAAGHAVSGCVATGSSATLHDLTLSVTGAAPLTVTGITVVTNLNVDMVDGSHAADFAHTGANVTFGVVTTTNLVATGSSPTFTTITANTGILSDITLSRKITLTTTGAADHTANGTIINGTAGETLVFGDVTYPSGGSYYKADAGSVTTMPAIAMCLVGAAAATGTTLLLDGIVRDDSWNWVGSPGVSGLIFVSGAAGILTQTAPSTTAHQVQVAGFAFAPTFMLWKPSLILVEIA